MKPVVVFRHARTEGAGYLGTFLEQNNIPWCEVRIDKGDPVPVHAREFSGLVLMGGPMSVNDPLPWIPQVLDLIRDAVAQDIPLLGHCLGGQLISKALGGVVQANPVKEIGWGQVKIMDNETAAAWFGGRREFLSFHWHGETFSLPEGACHLLSSTYCQNQAFAIGKHLAFQCHIEMTEEMVKVWCETGASELASVAHLPSVQRADQMQQELSLRIAALNQLADSVYRQWVKGLC